MTSRERVFTALAHKQPDRCPVDYWGTPETNAKMMKHFGVDTMDGLLDKLEVDVQTVYPRMKKAPEVFPDGTFLNAHGARVRNVSNRFSTYTEVIESPLAKAQSVEDVEAYANWQSPELYDWDSFVETLKPLAEKRVLRLETTGIFEVAVSMRGYQQLMMDFILNPEIVQAIMSRLAKFIRDYVQIAMDKGVGEYVDIIYTYDDIATQQSLMISHDMLEEFIYPYHRENNAFIHSFGKLDMFHSCGAVYPEIPSLIALPIDILNPLQPKAKGMDLAKIKAEFGDKVSFHGAIDIQDLLPFGTAEEVRESVRNTIRLLGKDGGYIMASAHYIQNDTPVENILAMYDPSIR